MASVGVAIAAAAERNNKIVRRRRPSRRSATAAAAWLDEDMADDPNMADIDDAVAGRLKITFNSDGAIGDAGAFTSDTVGDARRR